MSDSDATDRALGWAIWGNLAMGAAGLAAASLSQSQAVLVDVGFSLIGALSILAARRISARADAAPDRLRPFGYAANEVIFTTFRALLLLGLVLFALGSSAVAVVHYMFGSPPAELRFEPLAAYFGVVGIGAIYLMQDGPLAVIAPIGDRLLVLALCGFAVVQYARDFRGALAELAEVTAAPSEIATLRRAVRPIIVDAGARIVDLGAMKLGRQYVVTVFMATETPMTSAEVDRMEVALQSAATRALPGVQLWLILSEHGRVGPPVPGNVSPFD